jgi:hypothetical protein
MRMARVRAFRLLPQVGQIVIRREATERYNNHQFASNSNVPACSTGREGGDISLEGIIAIYEAAGLALSSRAIAAAVYMYSHIWIVLSP